MTDGEGLGVVPEAWAHAHGELGLGRPRVMAILNVTPDSFFDGGDLHDGVGIRVADLLARARRCVLEGADILDIGGESTRPGAAPVEPGQEHARVVPAIAALRADPALAEVPISVDTRRARVAAAALDAGASIVNDVSGLGDPDMAAVVAARSAGLVLGHLRGEPRTMQQTVRFADVLREVTEELGARVDAAVAAGIERPRIVVDPGIGFGKTAQQSAALVADAGGLRDATRCPVLIGASRKSFLGALGGGRPVEGRLAGSLAAGLVAVERGASVLRVHDVAETVQALAVAGSIRRAFAGLAADGVASGVANRAADGAPREVLR